MKSECFELLKLISILTCAAQRLSKFGLTDEDMISKKWTQLLKMILVQSNKNDIHNRHQDITGHHNRDNHGLPIWNNILFFRTLVDFNLSYWKKLPSFLSNIYMLLNTHVDNRRRVIYIIQVKNIMTRRATFSCFQK